MNPFFPLLFFIALPNLALAIESEPRELLAQVVSQLESQSFRASAVYIRPSGMETIDIERAEQFERITYNNEPIHQRIRTPLKEVLVSPIKRSFTEHRGKTIFNSLSELHKNPSKTNQVYNLFVSEHFDRVAGKEATRLSIISITQDRYSFIHWVDAESYIILRTDVLDENGELIERMVFTSFTLKDNQQWLSKSSIQYEGEKQQLLTYVKKTDSEKVRFTWLPAGFYIESIEAVYDKAQAVSYERVILSDGFAFIDVYTHKIGHNAKLTRGQQLDTLHVYKGVVAGQKVSLEGQVPYAILQKIALNIKLK
ncbi:MAG: MucB/RseB C-terminal domain-containing protein [Cycloclasticus sp.]